MIEQSPRNETTDAANAAQESENQAKHELWSASYRYYILFILTVVYVLNIADRQILNILQQSIKQELGFSDTQLGILSGFAFAVFYTFLGIPIARWADQRNRRNLIAAALTIWSGMTAVCGMVFKFWHLLLARIGVGVGEAGCTPPAVSIISDLFPQKKRATPMAIYALGMTLGLMAGYMVGGYLDSNYGWRTAFYAIGIPGLLFALIVRFTVREPPRGMADGIIPQKEAVPLGQAFSEMFGTKTFLHMAIGTSLLGVSSYGVGNWCPVFFIRIFEMSTQEVGNYMGAMAGLGGGAGTLIGGYLADKLGGKNSRWFMLVPGISGLISAPLLIGGFLVGGKGLSLILIGIMWIFGSAWYPAVISMSQGLVRPRIRAVSMAVILFLLNLIGMGIGPTAVGFLSDLLEPSYGVDSLRYALCIVSMVFAWAFFHFLIASRTVDEDLKKAGAQSA